MELLHFLGSAVSAQRPEHSFTVGGVILPLEARMGGIFVGYAVGLALLLLLGRGNSSEQPRGMAAVLVLSGVLATGIDGLNAVASDLGFLHIYSPSLTLRHATGLAAGFAVSAFALPAVVSLGSTQARPSASLEGSGEVIAGWAVLGLLHMVVEADVPALLLPLAILQVAAVIVAFAVATFGGLLALRAYRRATGQPLTSTLVVLSALLGTLEVGLLAFARA